MTPQKGRDIKELRPRPETRPDILRRKGYTYLGGTARRWRAPDGRELSRRAAYKAIHRPLMSREDWMRADALEGKARADFLRRKGYRIRRDPSRY